jgi:hypothetical protein
LATARRGDVLSGPPAATRLSPVRVNRPCLSALMRDVRSGMTSQSSPSIPTLGQETAHQVNPFEHEAPSADPPARIGAHLLKAPASRTGTDHRGPENGRTWARPICTPCRYPRGTVECGMLLPDGRPGGKGGVRRGWRGEQEGSGRGRQEVKRLGLSGLTILERTASDGAACSSEVRGHGPAHLLPPGRSYTGSAKCSTKSQPNPVDIRGPEALEPGHLWPLPSSVRIWHSFCLL